MMGTVTTFIKALMPYNGPSACWSALYLVLSSQSSSGQHTLASSSSLPATRTLCVAQASTCVALLCPSSKRLPVAVVEARRGHEPHAEQWCGSPVGLSQAGVQLRS